jgi:hypothetical protein
MSMKEIYIIDIFIYNLYLFAKVLSILWLGRFIDFHALFIMWVAITYCSVLCLKGHYRHSFRKKKYVPSVNLILFFHVNYLILIGWESLDKIYCRPLIDETTPKSVQKHNNGPHCMTTVSILKNIDCANFMRVRFAVDCKTTSFERL